MLHRRYYKRVKFLHQLIICGVAILLTVLLSSTNCIGVINSTIGQPIALAQLPSLEVPSETQILPSDVERQGTLESAKVRLDGRELFKIASPAVLDRSNPGGQIPVEVRAKQIEANLEQIVNSHLSDEELNPNTVQVVIETINGQPVLFVKDTTESEPKVLLTVTDTDAQYASTSKERLATQWKEVLERELQRSLELRQPEALQQQINVAVRVLSATLVLSLLMSGIWTRLRRRRKQLERRQATETTVVPATEPIAIEPEKEAEGLPLQGLQNYLGLQQRLQILRFLQWLFFGGSPFSGCLELPIASVSFPKLSRLPGK